MCNHSIFLANIAGITIGGGIVGSFVGGFDPLMMPLCCDVLIIIRNVFQDRHCCHVDSSLTAKLCFNFQPSSWQQSEFLNASLMMISTSQHNGIISGSKPPTKLPPIPPPMDMPAIFA